MAAQKCVFQTVILLVLFASIEISVAKQIESVFPIRPFDIDGCAFTLCLENTSCRVVHPCDTCEPRIQCIPSDLLGEGIDIECQRQGYQQVLLVENPTTPPNYSQLKCRGPLKTRDCPRGSVCVDDLRGGGTCCRGKPEPPVEKPGTCPQGEFSVCGGVFCEVDSDCPGAQKCCPGCGMLCTDPVLPPPVCEPKCSPGEECVAYPFVCPTNAPCISPTMCQPVEPVDPCGGCPDGQECVDTGIRCITTPCPTHQCQPKDKCGGCPKGEECQLVYPPCAPPPPCDAIRALDPDAECVIPSCDPVPICQPVPDPICPMRCGPRQKCTFIKICDWLQQCTREPRCVDERVPFCPLKCGPNERCEFMPFLKFMCPRGYCPPPYKCVADYYIRPVLTRGE